MSAQPTRLSYQITPVKDGTPHNLRYGNHMSYRVLHVPRLRLQPTPSLFCTRAYLSLRAMSSKASDIQATLADFSTCEVSDAMIKLGFPHGGFIPDINQVSPGPDTRICGPAYTVQMVLGSNKDSPKLSSHFVDTAPDGSVIVINAPDSMIVSALLTTMNTLTFRVYSFKKSRTPCGAGS